VLLESLSVDPAALLRRTGWEAKPQGMCKGDVCVPLPPGARDDAGRLDAHVLAERLGMPLVADDAHQIWALGPAAGVTGRALATATAPDLELPDVDGDAFKLSSLVGQKVVMVAWASW
jgi:hypothetical protein